MYFLKINILKLIFVLSLYPINIFSNEKPIRNLIDGIYSEILIVLFHSNINISWQINTSKIYEISPILKESYLVNAGYFDSKTFGISYDISINYGFLNYLKYIDELAFVIAHELAHYIIEKSESYNISALSEQLRADYLAISIISKTTYNPCSVVDLLERISKDKNYTDTNSDLSIGDRLSAIKKYLSNEKIKCKDNSEINETHKSYISALYERIDISYIENHRIVDALEKIEDKLDKEYDKNNIKKLINVIKEFSDFIIKNKEFNFLKDDYFNKVNNRVKFFLSGRLYKRFPDWIEDRRIIESRIYQIYRNLNVIISKISPASNIVDLHELIKGKSFFTGKSLDIYSQILAAIKLIINSQILHIGLHYFEEGILEVFDMDENSKRSLELAVIIFTETKENNNIDYEHLINFLKEKSSNQIDKSNIINLIKSYEK